MGPNAPRMRWVWAGLLLLSSGVGRAQPERPFPPGTSVPVSVQLPAALTVEPGQERLFPIHVAGDDSAPITITFVDLPSYVRIEAPGTISAGQTGWQGMVRIAPEAPAESRVIRIQVGSARFRGETSVLLTIPQSVPSSPTQLASRILPTSQRTERPGPVEAAEKPLIITVPLGPIPPPPDKPTPPIFPTPSGPWFLMQCLQGTATGTVMNNLGLQISGWTDASYNASSAVSNNLPLAFDYRANQFLLQQNWLRFEKPIVTSGTSEPSFGFRTDFILPGADYLFTLPRGIFNSQLTANNGQPNRYGIDPIQFYGEAYFPTIARGLDVKVGRFFAQYGVESNMAVDNSFLSHAYGFVYDPFTHTGILTTTKLTDAWSIQAGLTLGSDDFIDRVDTATYIGSVKWADLSGRDSVLYSVILGSGKFNQSQNFHNPEIFDFVYTHKINARMNYIMENLYGCTRNVPSVGFANWDSVVNYLTYEFAPRVSGATRLEFFEDFQGQRTGFAGLYSDLTAGLQIRPRKDVIIRPELRYDYNGESSPFEGKHGLFTAASDVIVRW